MLGGADPVGVERACMRGIHLAAPLEQEPLRGRRAPRYDIAGDRGGVPVGRSRRASGNGDEGSRQAPEILLRLLVGDVDELTQLPGGAQPSGLNLEVGGTVTGETHLAEILGGRQSGLGRLVNEKTPDLLERDNPDEVLDVDAAIPQGAAVAIGLGDLGLEGDHTLQARLELAHRSPLAVVLRDLTVPQRPPTEPGLSSPP